MVTNCASPLRRIILSISFLSLSFLAVVPDAMATACPEGVVPGCDGVCGSNVTYDDCGNCGGNNEAMDCAGVCGGTAVRDCAGVCEGDATTDCLGVCNGTAQIDCRGVCAGSAVDSGCGCGVSSCNTSECVWIVGFKKRSGYWSDASKFYSTSLDSLYDEKKGLINNSQALPGCFHDAVQKCKTGPSDIGSTKFSPIAEQTESVQFYGRCPYGPGSDLLQRIYLRKTAYLDANCKLTKDTTSTNICGFGGIAMSPISLLLDSDTDINSNMRVVKFSLSSDPAHNYTLWKASEKAPLLVYDPKRTGKVTSARQLFGNVAFGGRVKNVSSIADSSPQGYWEHGYEALALLDKNEDGKVSGAELNDIFLWFDKNRDALVQDGELRSSESEGIVSLFYKNVRHTADGEDLYIEIGFERLVDGKIIRGKSVDWFAENFSSKVEAMTALSAISQANPSVKRARPKPESLIDLEEPQSEYAVLRGIDHKRNISGTWVWHLDAPDAEKRPGLFVLDQKKDGTVTGFNFTESQLEQNSRGFRSAITRLPVKGKISEATAGEKVLELEVIEPEGGNVTRSKVFINPEGSVMRGTSTQTFSFARGGKTRVAKLEYQWKANKFNPDLK